MGQAARCDRRGKDHLPDGQVKRPCAAPPEARPDRVWSDEGGGLRRRGQAVQGGQHRCRLDRPCAAWGTGVISERAGDAGKGKWDIAAIPGGSGNWGGSCLAIPAQSSKKDAAYKLLTILTSKTGHLDAFKEKGTMPSTIAALDDPSFANANNEYFSNAPVGVIFGASVKSLKPIYLGPKHQQLWETILEPNMQAVERGGMSSTDAFGKSIADGKKLATG